MIVWFFHAKVGHCQTPIQKTPDYSGVLLCPEKMLPEVMSVMAGRHPYGVRSGLRRNGLKLWDIHFRMTRFIVARCGLLFATLKGKTMKKMFVLFCMLFSCAFSLAAVNINAASQQELRRCRA